MSPYFDNAATTQPYPMVVEAMAKAMAEEYANPSSLHTMGAKAQRMVDNSALMLLEDLGLESRGYSVIFTSGATESANLAIRGVIGNSANPARLSVLTTRIEHPCVGETIASLQKSGVSAIFAPVTPRGYLTEETLAQSLTPSCRLVSVIAANNEFGSVQDVKMIARTLRQKAPDALLHLDCVQAFGKVELDYSAADLISLSAHKFHGPKGVGALVVRKGVNLAPILFGGGQQGGIRSGTLNAPGIWAMALAARQAAMPWRRKAMQETYLYLRERLASMFGESVFNGPDPGQGDCHVPHILNFSVAGVKGEVVVHMCEEQGVYLSSGSACSTHHGLADSPLLALGAGKDRVEAAVRISWSEDNGRNECDRLLEVLESSIGRISSLRKRI